MSNPDRLLRRAEVFRITGMTRYMVDLLEQAGAFPKRIQIGQRAVFWSEAEIAEFIEETKRSARSASRPAEPDVEGE